MLFQLIFAKARPFLKIIPRECLVEKNNDASAKKTQKKDRGIYEMASNK